MTQTDKLAMMAENPRAYVLAQERAAMFMQLSDHAQEIFEPEDKKAQEFYWAILEDYFEGEMSK